MPELLGRLQGALADRYRIDREIGAGGMATVYLAQDIRHDRKVALKLLRPELSAVIGAERFLAEIKLTANLQHPHILPLFDSGEADGFLFYVMPFVEGESLRDRLNREKQLPVAEALRIAREVASALDYAHRHQVVHRDIKPENILLHDGQALVADFGIALAASKASGARMTETGMSLGTPHYMSPEQAMGEREITARSDVYALGAMLYEMLTGDPPFTGSTAQAIVARVLTESPRPLLPQRHTIPPAVEGAVLTALEKLPADRFGSAAEFAEALEGRGYVPTVPAAAVRPGAPATVGRRFGDRATLAAIGIAALATAAALWGWLRPGPEPVVSRASLFLPPEQALMPVSQSGNRVAISPDGKRMVYVGPAERGGKLWMRELDQLNSTPIPGTEGAGTPFFSPDSRHIGFLVGGSVLKTVSLDGGPVLTLNESVNSTGGDWGPDGYIYFEVDSGIARMPASGGPTEMVYHMVAQKEVGAEWPVLLPGARGVVFRTRQPNQGPADFQIVAVKLPAGERKVLMRGVYARYSPSGHLLVASSEGKLVAVPFDPEKLEVTGPPIGLLEGLGVEGSGFAINLALSETGTLVYTTGGATGSRRPVWVTREGVESPVDPAWQPQGIIASFAIAPDGKSLAVEAVQNGINSIWVKQLPAGAFSRVTFGDTSNLRPTWTADGRSLVYVGNATTPGGLPMTRRADGTGSARTLLQSTWTFGQAFETRDGKWLVVRRSFQEEGQGNIYAVRIGDTTLVPLATSPAIEGDAAVSPDGRWLAYTSNESGAYELYVRPFPDAASARWQVSVAGGSDAVWSRNGRELFFLNGQAELTVVDVAPGSGFSFSPPRTLFSTSPYTAIGPVPSFDVSPDGRSFVFLRETTPTDRNELIVVQNWVDEMRARAKR
jgi:tRNA A-37 threonylcarbamoyl transferase component Bud32/dipeptidyl aminopeptidase/acylaminoacyl peptidase